MFNETQGTYTSFDVTPPEGVNLVGNCAEWIVERPFVNGQITELANYNQVYFSFGIALHDNDKVSGIVEINQGNVVTMLDGPTIISVGAIISNTSLTCTYKGP